MKDSWFYGVADRFTTVLFILLTKLRVRLLAPVPTGPIIVMSNHGSIQDGQLINAIFRRKIAYFAKRELFEDSRLMGWIVSNYGCIPFNRSGLNRTAFRVGEEVLESGGAIGIFPEGTRNPLGTLQKGNPGAARFALQTGVPIVPVGLIGIERVRKWYQFLKRPAITVVIGEAFTLPKSDGWPSKAETMDASEIIMRNIAELMPEERRGPYRNDAPHQNPAPTPNAPSN